MDISAIHSVTKLKAMAYDEISKKESAERNLAVINQRITQVQNEEQPAPATTDETVTTTTTVKE